MRLLGNACCVLTRRNLGLLALDICRTLIQNGGLPGEFGDTVYKFVCVVQIFVARMSKSLVPKQFRGSRFDGIDGYLLLNNIREETVDVESCRK